MGTYRTRERCVSATETPLFARILFSRTNSILKNTVLRIRILVFHAMTVPISLSCGDSTTLPVRRAYDMTSIDKQGDMNWLGERNLPPRARTQTDNLLIYTTTSKAVYGQKSATRIIVFHAREVAPIVLKILSS